MKKEEFKSFYLASGYSDCRLAPAPIPEGFKSPSGVNGDVHGFLYSAMDRMAFGFEPLFKLSEALQELDMSDEARAAVTNSLKLVAVGQAQAYAQLSHTRRYLILNQTWNDPKLAKEVLASYYEDKPDPTVLSKAVSLFRSLTRNSESCHRE